MKLPAGLSLALAAFLAVGARDSRSDEPENECVRCHLEQEAEDEDLARPPKEWRTSIHHANGIACNDCHGGDPNASEEEVAHDEDDSQFIGAPEDDAIPGVCGECHVAVLENYLQSKHWETDKEKRPVCTTCHEAHPITKANLDLINEETCSECHPYERSKRIKVAMTSTEEKLVGLENRVAALTAEGLDTRAVAGAHFALRNLFHHLSHTLDLDRVIDDSETVSRDAQLLSARIRGYEVRLNRRRVAGGAFTVFLLLGAIVMHRRRKALDSPPDE